MNSPLLCVVGARPNFMKMAAILPALKGLPHPIETRLVHTGQHYDAAMKETFFQQLGIPEPDMDLGVGSGSHAVQTAEIMRRFEPVLDQARPCGILVVGDVNSTIACALVAAKKQILVVHVEAGLRSRDRTMPEEINRILTDQLSGLLFTTEKGAEANLLQEGISSEAIHFVGNVMIDTLLRLLPSAPDVDEVFIRIPPEGGKAPHLSTSTPYGLVTMHRPSNVDDPLVLKMLLSALVAESRKIPLIFPVHPRTRSRIREAGLEGMLAGSSLLILPPVGYLEMLGLMKTSKMILTDSGGIQEESTALGIPCLTLRENTERPITITQGTNTMVGSDPEKIRQGVDWILNTGGKAGRIPELWDGHAAERIAQILGCALKS